VFIYLQLLKWIFSVRHAMIYQNFPQSRFRRTRQAPWIRNLTRENVLTPHDLLLPLFAHDNQEDTPVANLPSVARLSLTSLVKKAQEAASLAIPAILLFPVVDPSLKNDRGFEALNADGLICRAIKAIKNAVPDIGIICDVALDPYTTHGHDGVLNDKGDVDNDATLELLAQQAWVLAEAGADCVAPSDMMDGRVAKIRAILEDNNHTNTLIMSYTAKYASAFYAPFREAVGSKGALKGDKKTYQMDGGNASEAIREAMQDVHEGADMLIVKPALPYLDVLQNVKKTTGLQTFAYQVSGEYAMLHAAARAGVLDYDQAIMETLLSCKRAGADGIITYAALDVAKRL
jgi:porphobilinogen synthase